MNRIVHFEIHAQDMDAMQKFYSDVFGWTMQDMGGEFGNYRVITTGPAMGEQGNLQDPGINGGMTPRSGPMPSEGQGVNAYVCIVGVDNTDAYVTKIQKAGGTLAVAAMEVPGVGRLAYCKDPEGNLFGILQPEPRSAQ
jgi:uncharacterized protein